MRRYGIRSYNPGDAEAVASLLARARRARRLAFPLLPSGLDEKESAARIVASKTAGSAAAGSAGTVATGSVSTVALGADGSLQGFLFVERKEDEIWGPSLRADVNDWALKAGTEALPELYAAAFGPVGEGLREHRVLCPASDETGLAAWFELGFGMEQAYAMARLEDLEVGSAKTKGDFQIRRAGPGDEENLESLSSLIAEAQAGPPVWAGAPAAYLAELHKGFAALAGEADAIVLLAFRGARPVGYQAWFPAEGDPLDGAIEGGVELAVGATIPEERGRGIGLALSAKGIALAQASGYRTCLVDWRTTNPSASSFWKARGFRPFLYRLTRRLP
ncbi:MAG TPA: GNAT family N-acetyltransferase [Rectinemataceae bacterium]|nr:GNAT family N-acetyltransferase [Rectinemataceae bacterium]